MELPILKDVVIILGFSVLIILLFQRLKMPSILGFLLTGIIAGPHGLSLVKASHEVEILAEMGIIFLLFVIGIEFSLKGLARIKNTVMIGGSLQVGGTILLTYLVAKLFGLPDSQAIFLGFLLSLSSTAIVLKMLQEQGKMGSQQGRIALGVLIFQDIIVVPMILVTPLLAGNGGDLLTTIIWLIAKFVFVLGFLFLMARYVVPKILQKVIATRSRELFILTIVVMIFATAWLTSSVGLSLALGAFFAGLIISESDYSHQATANILPFKEIFISFFFVSIGMLLDLQHFANFYGVLLLMTLGVIVMKMVVIFLMVLINKYPLKTAFISAFTIFQVGEFAFLLSTIGMRNNLLPNELYQHFLAVSIISMAITPFLIGYADQISNWLVTVTLKENVRKRLRLKQSIAKEKAPMLQLDEFRDHLVIIGYGLNGKNVAKTASQAKIPFVIVEHDPVVFEEAKADYKHAFFGDAASIVILQHLNVQQARVVVIAIDDTEITKQIISTIRLLSETAHVIVRTRYMKEIESILTVGADEVIPEEFETSIEIFTRVLNRYLVPLNEIQRFTTYIRAHNYDLLCAASDNQYCPPKFELHIPDMVMAALPVQQDDNKIVGKTIVDSGIKEKFNLTVLAIRRNKKYITQIQADTIIKTDDMLYLFGAPENIAKINKYIVLKEENQ
ncbi:MAG: cation:proton antiporter [Bacteroidetes bacterium]|nr:cation:proton antiporter [Bacteroidota bacterium]MBU1581105.1 cation:proton antiporter [Bacteroidota bacterium]MBU2466196.1 cation:proton antiporter [Bacteroidota bacterium]